MSSQWLKQWFPHLPSALDRAPLAGLMCAGAILLGVALAGARSSNPNENGAASSTETVADSTEKPTGENQGTVARFHEDEELVEQAGKFSMSKDRVVFVTAKGQHRFIALENRSLEGVANAIDGNPASVPWWIVSGKITEYRGSYYLLLTRAQRQSQVPK
jgi:hypothetical protein